MIVCMSRRICVALYHAIVKPRPQWHTDEDETGAIKIVMTGAASDPPAWQTHIGKRPKARRELLAKRIKKPDDPLKLVIVRDIWLTGFDAPCLHTMYVDKPILDPKSTPQARLSILAGAIDWVLTVQQVDAAKEATEEGKKRAHRRGCARLNRAGDATLQSDRRRQGLCTPARSCPHTLPRARTCRRPARA
jgi:hypothetical protein